MPTAEEIYDKNIRRLSPAEQLRVAALILQELAGQDTPPAPRRSMLEISESLPPGPRAFPTWEECERSLQEERDAWDR